MNFFKKIFQKNLQSSEAKEVLEQEVNLALDDLFVHNFIHKGGKFLYSTSKKEILKNLIYILEENKWSKLVCLDENTLAEFTDSLSIDVDFNTNGYGIVFTTCEYLIADNGGILFSSNQLTGKKLCDLSDNFIVFARTSQFVQNMGQSLTGIKSKYKEQIPTNICSINNFSPANDEENFISTSNSNSKNLYLLLLEDL